MSLLAKRIPQNKEGNRFYPLPPDYHELTLEGKRQARVNAARQWLVPVSHYPGMDPLMAAESLAASVRFLDLYYLHPDHEVDFDPLFYDDVPMRTPMFHWEILKQWAQSEMNIAIAPRGAAKSFLATKTNLLRLLTRPMYSIIYATSTMENAEKMGLTLKQQLRNNPRIEEDWFPEFADGYIVPKRGESKFSTNYLMIKNGSWIRCVSAESKLRGGRPRRFVLDDPEYDPKASTSMQMIRQYMDTLLFKMVLPMIMRQDCGVDWLATFVSKRHYAWHALQVEEDPNNPGHMRAVDERFDHWSRYVVRAAMEVDDPDHPGEKRLASCWPEMWPSDDAERRRLNIPKAKTLVEIRERVGTPIFLAEYMARPGEHEDQFFGVLKTGKHDYTLIGPDDKLETHPTESLTTIRWHNQRGEPREMSLREFCRGARLFMTVDTSYTATKDSDFKVACLMGINSESDLFILDLWAKQCQEQDLVRASLQMADRWKCKAIYVEAIKAGISVYNAMDSIVRQRAKDFVNVDHLARIAKFNPGMIEKPAKISTLGIRFEYGRIKLPLQQKDRTPWRYLFDQIAEFNPDAPDGGLKHDDCIDCVAMSTFILKGQVRPPEKEVVVDNAPLARMKRGELHNECGYAAHAIDWRSVPLGDILDILQSRTPEPSNVRRPTKA